MASAESSLEFCVTKILSGEELVPNHFKLGCSRCLEVHSFSVCYSFAGQSTCFKNC